MLLAFLIPSLQDQWDRFQSRKVISQYESLGDDFFREERYDMAEEAYQKAFELSDSKLLDIEVKRLNARINRINMKPEWGAPPPEDLLESDFQFVLHLQKGKDKQKDRINTLNSYGVFLAASHKPKAAQAAFEEAVRLDSSDALAYVNLGNLFDQEGRKTAALQQYELGIARDPTNARAHYNLGLLYAEQGRREAALQQLKAAMQYDSTDTDAARQYELLRKEQP